MMKLKWIFKKKNVRKWTGLRWLMIRTGGGGVLKGGMRLWVPRTAENSLKDEELFVNAA
jgi:hypothetical protein